MSLDNLPPELILLISDHLDSKPLNALIQTASYFARLLDPVLQDRVLAKSEYQQNLLVRAAKLGHEATIRKIHKRAQHRKKEICTPIMIEMLMWATTYQHTQLMEYILRGMNTDVNSMSDVNGERRTPLHEAAQKGYEASTRKLLELGADIDALDEAGRSALHFAVEDPCQERSTAVLELTLEHGANTEVGELYVGNKPLHWAITDKVWDGMEVLLDHGADIEACNGRGETALHVAAAGGTYSSVALLNRRGSDIFALTNAGHTCLDLAGTRFVADYLQELGALTGKELRDLVSVPSLVPRSGPK
ncbi:Ankyrin repeat protein [Aspergillus clavatus NRRL 1]|uniref:Ankyrin repeat protein n=1 Tax=Aspergillus clavatus (strain ATCC 1007 / CBS 513.65 / DSM 816 / NCTC 3887 / NRRL 1 / QM 1276 / 107) TaxID=344612 RepID=A1CI45_ASPCL|nr:Ankyrin repeat protein [Aspergillus clavatus NRRL 1]EAW10550.1 Ankyrin repeat protein [Aspergillus clavatus NRRL 1]